MNSTPPVRTSSSDDALQPTLYLAALLNDYRLARDDERNWFPVVSALVTLIVTTLGALAFETQTDTFTKCLPKSDCGAQRDLLLVLFPLAPLAGLGLIALAGMQSTIRSRYLRTLEREIRAAVGRDDSRVRSLPRATRDQREEVEAAFLLRWSDISSSVNETRRGQTIYRLIVDGLFLGIAAIYAGLLSYIGLHIDKWAQAALAGIYVSSTVILVGALLKSWLGADALWEEVTTAVAIGVNPDESEVEGRGEPLPERLIPARRPRLLRYLIFPRTLWLGLRILITLAAVVLLTYGFAAHRATGSFDRVVVLAAAAAVLFEWGPYATRNQWTDLRRRERLPFAPTRASHRANIYTSATVASVRVIVPLLWLQILVPQSVSWALWVCGVLLASILIDSTIEYTERRLGRRSGWTRAGDLVARFLAFAARGLAIWRVAVLLGATFDTVTYVAEVVVMGLVGFSWGLRRQRKEARILSQRIELDDASLDDVDGRIKVRLKRSVVRTGYSLGEILFGRAFEHIMEARSSDTRP
jgi:hypothetical protein